MIKKNILLIGLSFILHSFMSAQGFIWNEDIQNQYEEIDLIKTDSKAVLPSSSSLEAYIPSFTWTQGKTQLCVAYALAYARTILYCYNKKIRDKDKIQRSCFSPGFMYWCAKPEEGDCFDGLNPIRSLNVLKYYGIAPIISVEYKTYYPFTNIRLCYYYPPSFEDDLSEASLYKIDEYTRVTNVSEVKSALSNGTPCLYGIFTPPSFDDVINKDLWEPYRGESASKLKDLDVPPIHALVVIAYDDYKYGGAFQIFNSWGDSWGKNGKIWIKYDDFFEYQVATFGIHRGYESSSFGTSTPNVSIPEDINLPNFSKQSELVEEEVDYLDVELFNDE